MILIAEWATAGTKAHATSDRLTDEPATRCSRALAGQL